MILEGLYILAKILVLYIQRLYYKDPVVINEPFTKIDKPTIVVSNHPNTLLDAVFAAATVSEQVKFLANYSLFKSKFGNWFFSNFYCIPIQRPEDVKDGQTNNMESLARSHQFLKDGGTLYIAAEGYSIQVLGIRALKTGAARIGLATEAETDWTADVQILPVGLNYDRADRFRSNLVVHVGKPFNLKEWRLNYYDDPKTAAKTVTAHLTSQMKSILLDADEKRTALLTKLRTYYSKTKPTDPKREYLRTRNLLVDLKAMEEHAISEILSEINHFEDNCASNGFSGEQVAEAQYNQANPIPLSRLILSLPITFFGIITNALPYLLCHWIEQKANKHLVYRSTFRTMTGIIFFPLMYLFWMWCVSYMTNNVILTLGSVILYRRSGIYAWHQIKDWARHFRSNKIIKGDPQHINQLNAILSSFHKVSTSVGR